MVATDLIEELPNAMKPFDKINSSQSFSKIRGKHK
jgi:hypothetical protein